MGKILLALILSPPSLPFLCLMFQPLQGSLFQLLGLLTFFQSQLFHNAVPWPRMLFLSFNTTHPSHIRIMPLSQENPDLTFWIKSGHTATKCFTASYFFHGYICNNSICYLVCIALIISCLRAQILSTSLLLLYT